MNPAFPNGTNPAPKIINASAGLKLRAAPSLSDLVVRVMAYQEAVTVYGQPVISADGYNWQRVTDAKGNSGWGANFVAGAPAWVDPAPVEDWIVDLDLPFVSQIDGASSLSNNDCGIASLLMQERYWFDQHGLSTPMIPSVDDLARRSVLAQPNPPSGLTFAQIQQLALLTGFQTSYQSGLTPDKLISLLDARSAVMVLVDYSIFNPVSGSKIPHLCIVSGYSASYFLCQDPYKLGKDYRILKAQLDAAMKTVPQNTGSYQGLVIV